MNAIMPIALIVLLCAAAFFTDDPATALAVIVGTGYCACRFREHRPRPEPFGGKLIPRARFH